MEQQKDAVGFKQILYSIPKTEIHLHLEALASVDTIWTLSQKNNLHYAGVHTHEDLRKKFDIKNLNEFIEVFINIIQNSFKVEEDFAYLINDAGAYLKSNNIVYAEIFFAPTKFIKSGFKFERIIDVLTNGAAEIEQKHNIHIKYLIDVSRTFGPENALNNLDLTIKHRTNAILGIGLGGSESAGPAADYVDVFKKARENGLHTVAHAGEDLGPEAIWNTIHSLHPERIGHGVSAIQDKKLMAYLAEQRIPLEMCPTSNLFTRTFVQRIEDHPVKQFLNNNLFVTVNSDDPTLFSTSLINEYMNLYIAGIFTQTEIAALLKNNIYATFLPLAKKDALWAQNKTVFFGDSGA